jgi:hypothetical protein
MMSTPIKITEETPNLKGTVKRKKSNKEVNQELKLRKGATQIMREPKEKMRQKSET